MLMSKFIIHSLTYSSIRFLGETFLAFDMLEPESKKKKKAKKAFVRSAMLGVTRTNFAFMCAAPRNLIRLIFSISYTQRTQDV